MTKRNRAYLDRHVEAFRRKGYGEAVSQLQGLASFRGAHAAVFAAYPGRQRPKDFTPFLDRGHRAAVKRIGRRR